MRRFSIFASLLLLVAATPRRAHAQGMAQLEVLPTFQSEGFNPVPFSVTCPTATWAVAIASDTISRSTFFEAPASSTQTVCLLPMVLGVLPTVAVSSQCVTATKGIELAPNSWYTDYTHVGWACAASSGTVSQPIKGVRTRDRGDYGNINSPELQR